eukprot:symbB.v1.2.005371.t3/scaffold313.1/size231106/7
MGFALAIAVLTIAVLAPTRTTGTQKKPHLVLHLSSETSDKEVIKGHRTVESVVGDVLGTGSKSQEQRRQQVIRLLQAGGFQMYNQETGDPIGNPMEYIRDGLQLLQDALGGRCKTVIIATISPALASVEETISALSYAEQAAGIRNRPVASSLLRSTTVSAQARTVAAANAHGDVSSNSGLGASEWAELEMKVTYLSQELEEAQVALGRKYQEAQEGPKAKTRVRRNVPIARRCVWIKLFTNFEKSQ